MHRSPSPYDRLAGFARGAPYIKEALILGLAVGVFGGAFGVLAVTSGLSLGQTMAMSFFVFTGASQFAAVGIIAGGGTSAAAVAPALLLAGRNTFYGIAMARHLPRNRIARLLAAQLTIDESTAMAVAQPDRATKGKAFLAAGLSVFIFWNAGTFVGAIGGGSIGDPASLGLDAAFPAGFISLIWPALSTRSGFTAAAAGAGIALVAIPFTAPGVPVLLAAFGASAGLVGSQGTRTHEAGVPQ